MSEDLTRNLRGDSVEQILTLLRGMDSRLSGLEERVDRRLMETRPIWEQVLGRLERVETRLEAVETRLDAVDTRLDGVDKSIDNLGLDMRAGFKRLERQMGQLATEYVAVRSDQSDLERRMDRLEDKLEAKPVG